MAADSKPLNTQNSLGVGDGFEFSAPANGCNRTDAVNNACHGALGVLLFAKASQVWLRPAQWSVLEDDIIRVADMLKWASQSAIIGDITTGDELSRVQPLPRPLSRGWAVREQYYHDFRDTMIKDLLDMEIGAKGCTVAVGRFSTSSCLLFR